MKILFFHGVGHEADEPGWQRPWEDAVRRGLERNGLHGEIQFAEPVLYDDLFEQESEPVGVYLKAVSELLSAWAAQSVAGLLGRDAAPARNIFERIPYEIHWRAGIVAEWIVRPRLRAELRARFRAAIEKEKPDVIAAHSHGSLISYDLFRHDPAGAKAIAGRTFLSFGSQIGHPAVVARMWGGRVSMINARFWHHLWNRNDPVFTQAINLPGESRFHQTTTLFGNGFLDVSAHSPVTTNGHAGYLDHPATDDSVWRSLAGARAACLLVRGIASVSKVTAKPRRRALLVGINEYPDPKDRLEGCVNDTFLISALLQERGFAPEDIRVVTNDRATAQGIRERLAWLLDGAEDGMERVFFYSGHGGQLPGYNPAEKVDHMDECLIPWDFAWTKDTAITDDDFFGLYANLPLGARFLACFDCCHAGGIHRDGGPRVRGIVPPDDIRHRSLEWDAAEQMWRDRKLDPLTDDFGGEREAYMGENGATYRIGRAMRLRKLSKSSYQKLPPDQRGPYLPVIIEACQEKRLSYEYRDGAVSYGAFTYSFVKNLRERPRSSFVQAVDRTAATLLRLGYRQEPQILGPAAIVRKQVPGYHPPSPRARSRP